MLIARVAALVLSTSVAVGTLGQAIPVQAATGQTAPALPASTQYTFTQLVNAVPAVRPLVVGYPGQAGFIPPAVAAKRDARGCTLKQRTLIAAATTAPKVGKRCKIVGGVWTSTVSGRQIKGAKGVVMDLVMPLKQAWAQGASAWTPAQRLAWATNVGTGKSVRAKGVTSLQATNVVLTAAEATNAKKLAADDRVENFTLGYLNSLEFCNSLSLGLGCVFNYLAYVGSYYQENAGQITDQMAMMSCNSLGAYLSNLLAWGLAIDPAQKTQLSDFSANCKNFTTQVSPQTALNGITPLQQPSVVPTLTTPGGYSFMANKAIAPPFDGYAAAVTDPIPASLFGMHAPVDWGSPGFPIGSLRLWDAGVSWREIETKEGEFNWGTLDRSLADAQNSTGTGALYVLGNAPTWANGDKAGNTLPASSFGKAANFITKLCQHAKGKIAKIEVWNEGNLSTYWTGTPQELADLTKQVSNAAKACDSNIQVLASSTGVRAQQAFGTNYDAYLDALAGKGWPVDGYTVHSYPSANGGPADRIANLAQFKSMLVAHRAPVKPIYDTEMNYGLAGMGEGKVDVPERRGAAFLSQSYIQTAQYGVDGLYWYVWSPDGDPTVGIQFTNGTPEMKAAWNKSRGWLIGSRIQRCGNSGPLQICQFTDASGANFSLLWLDSEPADPNLGLTSLKGLGTRVEALVGEARTSVYGDDPALYATVGITPIKVS